MNTLLHLVKEQGIVDIINDYKLQMEQRKYKKKLKKCLRYIKSQKTDIYCGCCSKEKNSHFIGYYGDYNDCDLCFDCIKKYHKQTKCGYYVFKDFDCPCSKCL